SVFHSTNERPEKRQRKHAPVDAPERRFHFHFFFVGARRVTNRQTNREPGHERAQNHRHRIFAKEQFRPFPRHTRSSANLFPATGWWFQNAGRAAAAFTCRRLLFRPEWFVVHKIIFDRIHH